MNIIFAPLISIHLLIIVSLVALAIIIIGLIAKQRAIWLRMAAFLLMILALTNPTLVLEDTAPVKNIVAIIVDKSQSQQLQQRAAQTENALETLTQRLSQYPDLEIRIKEFNHNEQQPPATQLFEELSVEIADIPSDRLAAAIFITDGQVHDIPTDLEQLGITSPIHALITGFNNEVDLRVDIQDAPRFGIVNETQEIIYRIALEGDGNNLNPPLSNNSSVDVEFRLNGELLYRDNVPLNQDLSSFIEIPRRGENLIEISIAQQDNEVTGTNNKTIAAIEGIRQNLRVLLVSGAPHSGERAWRNLLKSDTSVDLVHFTILRPPEKSDGTPITELSLIAFPTRELFIEKIDSFDLIILDRYQNLGVLPILYYDNIARYIEDGGALLIAAGPEFASTRSIANTPLAPVLPAMPTGNVKEAAFHPTISELGKRHPVSRDLEGSQSEPPNWGRWFRSIDVRNTRGDTIMNGPDGQPLLVLKREGKGRIAMLLSDHGWLWSRGFEGGGPHISLYRRIAHWLMEEPALEEEALFAEASKSSPQRIDIARQTMSDNISPVQLTSPSGNTETIELEDRQNGRFTANIDVTETGLYEITSDEYTALVHMGDINAKEFKDNLSTTQKLTPLSRMSKGITKRLTTSSDAQIAIPRITAVRNLPATLSTTSDRMLLKMSGEKILIGVDQIPLFGGLLGLIALLLTLSFTWYREGK